MTVLGLSAQTSKDGEYRMKATGANQIHLFNFIGELEITGHNSDEIVIKSLDYRGLPEKAKGLKPLSAYGVDNTNIGLYVNKENGVVEIAGASKTSAEGDYEILLPKNTKLKISSESFNADDIIVTDMTGELEIKANASDLILHKIEGPIVLSNLNGDIEIIFTKLNQTSPSSVSCVNGDIEMTLPGNTPMSLNLSAINGDVFTNLDLKIVGDKEKMKRIGGSINTKATNAGGGVEVSLSAVNGEVYLRKKE